MTQYEIEKKIANACLTCPLSDCRYYSTQCQLKKVRKEIKKHEENERNEKRKKKL